MSSANLCFYFIKLTKQKHVDDLDLDLVLVLDQLDLVLDQLDLVLDNTGLDLDQLDLVLDQPDLVLDLVDLNMNPKTWFWLT